MKVELIFNAEVSNVLIVNARVLGEDDLDLTVTFDMLDVSKMACFNVIRIRFVLACSRLSISRSERNQRRAKTNEGARERGSGERGSGGSGPPHFFLARPPLVVWTH